MDAELPLSNPVNELENRFNGLDRNILEMSKWIQDNMRLINKISHNLDLFDIRSDIDILDSIFESDEEEKTFMNQKCRIKLLEDEIEHLKGLLLTDAGNISQKRAMQLKETIGDNGHITRKQVKVILGNCHHETARRAMETANNMYDELEITRNHRTGEIILKTIK